MQPHLAINSDDPEKSCKIADVGQIEEKQVPPPNPADKDASVDENHESRDDNRTVRLTPPSNTRIILIMIALVLAVFVVCLDNFVLAPALPIISAELSANDASYAWIESSQLLTCALAVPIYGSSSDIFGRKPILVHANILFFVGTFLGGFATNVAMLIAGRAVQGIGCGGMLVMADICVVDLFSARKRGVYFSILGTFSAIASAAGPCIGGALTGAASWRWCFWINIPLAAISFLFLVLFLDLPKPEGSLKDGVKNIDWAGTATFSTGATLLLVGLQLGGIQYPWSSAVTICLIVFGVAVFVLFFVVEGKVAKEPLIPLRLFASRSRVATLSVMVAQAIVSTGGKLFLPLYYQLVLGVTPLMSAVYLLPFAITISLILPVIGWFIKRTGKYRILLLVGSCILVLGTGLLIDSKPYTDWPLIVIPQLLLAFGQGLTYQSPLIAFQAQIERADTASGQSAYQFLRSSSQIVGVILGQVVFQSQVQLHNVAIPGIPADLNHLLTTGSSISATTLIQNLPPPEKDPVLSAITAAFNDMWILYTCIAFVGFAAGFGVADVPMED